jgi:hypothetical protein
MFQHFSKILVLSTIFYENIHFRNVGFVNYFINIFQKMLDQHFSNQHFSGMLDQHFFNNVGSTFFKLGFSTNAGSILFHPTFSKMLTTFFHPTIFKNVEKHFSIQHFCKMLIPFILQHFFQLFLQNVGPNQQGEEQGGATGDELPHLRPHPRGAWRAGRGERRSASAVVRRPAGAACWMAWPGRRRAHTWVAAVGQGREREEGEGARVLLLMGFGGLFMSL